MNALNVFRRTLALSLLVLAAVLLAPAQVLAAEAAGKIVFAVGKASIVDVDGNTRPARRGESIFSGETIVTDDKARMQVRYSDGSFVSLLPKSEYKIDEYKFTGSADGSERGFFRLLKGGMRTVTGAIGKVKKDNYKVTTPVATIGIRGTWFSALLDEFGRLLINVGFDPDDPAGLRIANAAGVLELNRGESAVVENADTPPVKTERQFVLDPPPPPDIRIVGPLKPSVPGGGKTIVNLIGAVTDNATTPPIGVDSNAFKDVAVVIGSPPVGLFGSAATGTPGESFATIDLDQTLAGADAALLADIQLLLDETPDSLINFFEANPAQNVEFQEANSVLSWGRWTGGRILIIDNELGTVTAEVDDLTGNQSLHYIYGTAPGPLPTMGSASYTFIGGTSSTSESGATIGAGVTSGSLFVNFNPVPDVSLNMNVNHDSSNYFVFGTVSLSGELFSDDFGGAVMGSGGSGACITSCGAKIDGFLAGPPTGMYGAPSNAGLSYIILETDPIHGVAGFEFDPFGE